MKWSTLAAAVLASPAAFATPLLESRTPGSFKVGVKHVLGEQRKLNSRSTGQDGVTFNGYWLADVSAGGQDATVLLDTGSADLWLLSPQVSSDQTAGQKLYDPTQSSTASQLQGYTFDIGYGEGGNGVSGDVWTDTFSVGTATVQSMPIGVANTLSGVSPGTFQSGIMGLAFQGGNSVKPNQQPTFMEALQPQLDQPVFVANFKIGGGGFIEFGTVDSSLYTGDLATLQADNTTTYPASWSSEGVQYVSNGNTLGTFDIVFDTGGPGSSGPIDAVRAYYAQISGAKDVNGDGSSWTVPCGQQLPDLEFHFSGGAVGTIPGANMYNGDNGDGTCPTWFVKENSATRGLVGDAFFNSNVVIFNQATATIQWAPQA
ncbi:acid protease [Coniophora puteana RWD-64-598 SS2]|uniref:Acid protease n=1 Tax=Coniophora puteana (strain RWD-64-598) TaxID=741705 RepID=A0A5M3MQM0_CONPW|nr:acid protease [Coniophora puteana RWD-64-598 SS2]EIW80801.1 acid protease [Coniophora puteana RWD-64-598 SS2]